MSENNEAIDEQVGGAATEPEFNLQSALYSVDDADLIDLPSGDRATVVEMTGREQRNFMNRSKQMSGVAIQELLGACTATYNEALLPTDPAERTKFLLGLLSGDRATLLFQIRRHSLGSDFIFSAKCPNPTGECGKVSDWEVDLNIKEDFPITPYKLGQQRDIEYDSEVSKGLKVKYTQLDGNAEMTILRKRNSLNILSDLEMRKPQAWDGKKWQTINLQRLPDKLLSEMRKKIREYEGSIRTTVDLVCDHCGQEVSFDLLQQPDFMTPNVTS